MLEAEAMTLTIIQVALVTTNANAKLCQKPWKKLEDPQ